MKVNKKVFVPDLAGDIGGTPGKGIVRLKTKASNTIAIKEPKILSNVRFNEFQTSLGATHLIDRVSPTNTYSFQRGVPNDGNRSVDIGGALTSREIYQKPALTHSNFASADVKMVTEYVQRALSLGNKYLPARTFVELQDASALRLSVSHRERTIMLRMMVDSSRTGATSENKAVLAIADAAGSSTSYQINVQGVDGVSNGIQINSLIKAASGADNSVSTVASKIKANKWYTVFFRSSMNSAGNSVNNTIDVYEIQGPDEGNLINAVTNTTSINPAVITGTPRMYIGYGELAGGVNADFRLSDFISGVHIAEFAAWEGYLSSDTIAQIAASHLRRNQYESGIDSRPVKRAQQIFDSMDAYPSQQAITGKKLSTNIKDNLFDTTVERTFGQLSGKNVGNGFRGPHHELMVYPEMIPARLYSGSGGTWYNGSYSPYASTGSADRHPGAPLVRIPLKDGQFRDLRGTPFQDKLVTSGAVRPGVMHKETELLNKISVHDYLTPTGSLLQAVTHALGGLISPFNDNQGGDSSVINEIAVPPEVYPGLDQKIGDIITIEIPIPSIDDTIMGADPTQGRIASMAYYNFSSQAWDRKFMPGISGSNIRSAADLGGTNGASTALNTSFWQDARKFLVSSCSIGFGGTSGFTIFSDERDRALMELSTRGRPTSMYGFPHTDQYVAAGGQTLKISDYIDGPFLLEKIAIEFDAEVEESGPSSIATIIRTPGRWKAAVQDYKMQASSGDAPARTTRIAGIPGTSMFYRSADVSRKSEYISGKQYDTAVDMVEWLRTWGGSSYQAGLVDPTVWGWVGFTQLAAQAHANPYPTFVGGSTTPAYAEFFDQYQQLGAGYMPAGIPNWERTEWHADVDGDVSEGFPTSADRMFSIQDTTNDAGSFSGGGTIRWRGWKNEGAVSGKRLGAPDYLSSVEGYYSSAPALTKFYNIPAGLFLPQIERAISLTLTASLASGRRDGSKFGGGIKLLFGGLSGLVTGSYTPNEPWFDSNAGSDGELKFRQYDSSGSAPRPLTGNNAGPAAANSRWSKPEWMSRNYISFVDSFSIDSIGKMISTTGLNNNSSAPGGAGGAGYFNADYPPGLLPKATGGSPFWRCDTFFLLHQKKGKARFVAGEADVVTAPEKQSFEKLQGETQPSIGGNYDPADDTLGIDVSPFGYLKNRSHQSAVLASAYSDGLSSWVSNKIEYFASIPDRRKRIRIEETLDEFVSSTRTTQRELITYAQVVHFGYAASEAVIPGAIIPAENYYASASAVGGAANGAGIWSSGMMKGTGPTNTLLPVSRSFYSQAIKLGATNDSWAVVGQDGQNEGYKYRKVLGPGVRTANDTRHRLFSAVAPTHGPKYYSTASDQAMTYYSIDPTGGAVGSAAQLARNAYISGRGIMGKLARTGTAGSLSHNAPATWGANAMFLDPGAGSGNGLFWRFSEYDAIPDNGFPSGPSVSTSYTKGKQFMRVFRWDQWFENPVYGGQRDTWINTTTSPGSIFPPSAHSIAATDYSGGVSKSSGVTPGKVPIAVKNIAHGASGSHCGTKLNYMQIDWRYQCGTHYNSGVDVAPIGTTPGKRYRVGERSMMADGSQAGKMVWTAVGGRAFTDRAGHVANELTGSDFIGSMISSASQPWHGTAITRTGFSIITSPTTPVPIGNHPDYTSYGSFNEPGIIRSQGGVGGYCSIASPLYLNPDRIPSGTRSPVKVSSWLRAGLSRDLDIEVGYKFTHKRKDLNNGIAGFTILTASTVFPPGDFAGRFNGDHKLRATFKERRLLNASSFRIVSDIKSQPAAKTDSAALFCFTVPAKRQFLVGTASLSTGDVLVDGIWTHHDQPSVPPHAFNKDLQFGDNSRFSNDRIWWRAYGIDSGYIGDTTSQDWETLVGTPPSLTSGRRYTAAVPGNIPIGSRNLSSGSRSALADVNVPQWAPGPGPFRMTPAANALHSSPYTQVATKGHFAGRQNQGGSGPGDIGMTSRPMGQTPPEWSNAYVPYTSSSLAADKPQTSLYLLMPGDEIVLGFQPSLHGSNRGINSIPTNVNVNPYGPWRDGIVDRQGIPTGSAYNPEWNYATNQARPQIVDSRGQGGWHLRRGPNTVLSDGTPSGKSVNNANMESLYEPRSSFTIKKSRNAKLVLYGTLLRDTKHVPPQSTIANQRTAAVHEAIVGAPIVDQYQIEPTYVYSGSYIAHHITGSIFQYQKNKFAMGLPEGAPGDWESGKNVLPFTGSVYDPDSPSYIRLGAPRAYLQEYERRVWRPNIAYNKKLWKGLGGPNYKVPSAADGGDAEDWSHNYWPKALSTSLSMGISGSVQRFVRLADDSEFYFDSFIPNPAQMNDIDLTISGSMAAKGAYAITKTQIIANAVVWNLGDTTSVYQWSNIQALDPHFNEGNKNPLLGYKPFFPNQYFKSSFPFENRYKSVQRMIDPTITGFGTSGSRGHVAIMNNLHSVTGSMGLISTVRVAQPEKWNPGWVSGGPEESVTSPASMADTNEDSNIMTRVLLFGFWKTEYRTSGPQPTLTTGIVARQPTYPPTHNFAGGDLWWKIDHPSGWRYGLMNYRKTRSTAVFRHDTYGQFRDMLEQRQYTKFYDTGDEFNPAGLQESAVTCIFLDADGSPTSDPLFTSCLNVSQEMTSSIPYKEGTTARTFIFNSQLVTISPLVQSFAASPFLSTQR